MGPNTGPSGDIADTTAVASEQMSPPAAPSKQGVGTRNQSIIAINTSPPAPSMDNEAYSVLEEDVCWICLDGAKLDSPLMQPCKCPRFAHKQCLARWQLQSAGTRRETRCEFCDSALPDWKRTLTPPCGATAPAVMNVNFDGRTYSFEVKPGPDGYKAFTEAIRRAFSLPQDSELNITFTCDEPSTTPAPGSLLTLQGAGAYDAAVHCASVSAARRMLMQTTRHPPGNSNEEAASSSSRSVSGTPRQESTLMPQLAPATPQPGEGPRYSSSAGSVGGDSASLPATPGRRGSWRKIKSICEGLLNRANSSGRQQHPTRETSPPPPGGDDSVYDRHRTS